MIREDCTPPFSLQEGIAAARNAPTAEAFHRSPFYRVHGPGLERWLRTIRGGAPGTTPQEGPDTRPENRIRLVHWNIEQGKRWDRLVRAIRTDPRLAEADLWTVDEVDLGTARTQNRDVARELARLLGLYWVWVPNYLELTKGPGQDALAPGENEIGLHGVALFSRWPLEEPGCADLPSVFDYFRFPEEKRYGTRRLLWAWVRHPRRRFLLATAHLEVRNTPAARARQMAAALAALPEGPCWFAGDWNTHTFRRGTIIRSVKEFVRLQRTPGAALERNLLAPFDREPLLRRVEEHGFRLDPWNDGASTAQQVLSGVEELSVLPRFVRGWLARRFQLSGRLLRLRLDWIAARGPWIPAEVAAPHAWTLAGHGPDGTRASDHAPIGVDALWPWVDSLT